MHNEINMYWNEKIFDNQTVFCFVLFFKAQIYQAYKKSSVAKNEYNYLSLLRPLVDSFETTPHTCI